MTTAPIPAVPDEWDGTSPEWVASLKDDDTLTLRRDAPRTISELVVLPGYSQTEWDRRQVRQLQTAMIAEAYLWDNLHKTDEVLVYDLLLMLGRPRAASAHMAAVAPEPICAELAKPAKPKRVRPSRARKAVTGASRDPG